jgi:hypothetical protein
MTVPCSDDHQRKSRPHFTSVHLSRQIPTAASALEDQPFHNLAAVENLVQTLVMDKQTNKHAPTSTVGRPAAVADALP